MAGRPASGYLVSHAETNLWVDAGPGTYLALAELIEPRRLHGVFLSHRHPDHCADIFALYHALAYGPASADRIPVFCPEGLAEVLLDFVDRTPMFSAVFEMVTLAGGDSSMVGGLLLSVVRANHGPPTLSLRVSAGGAVLSYTADTGPSPEVTDHVADSDLLLAEASMVGRRSSGTYPHHMTAYEAGEMAAQAQVRKLMLTHVPPHVDPARAVCEAESTYAGEVGIAVPGARIPVHPRG